MKDKLQLKIGHSDAEWKEVWSEGRARMSEKSGNKAWIKIKI